MKRKLLKDVVTTLLPILFCFTLSCNDANNGINTNSKFDTSKQVVPAPADTVHSLTSKKDTIYTEIYLEDSLKNYGHFGATISEWNTRLAVLAKSNIVTELFESVKNNKIYDCFIKIDDIRGLYISGIFKFPKEKNDTIEYFIRDGVKVNEGILIGINFNMQIPNYEIEPFFSFRINSDSLVYKGGQNIPEIKSTPPTMSEFGYQIGGHPGPVLSDFITPTESHYYNIYDSTTEQYLSAYEGKAFYSIFDLDVRIYGNLTCFCSKESSGKMSSDLKPEYNVTNTIVQIKDLDRKYFFSQTLWSKTQSGININDFYTDEQKGNINKQNNTQSLINKALNRN